MGNTPSQSTRTKRKEYNSPSVTERWIKKLEADAAAERDLKSAIFKGENPGTNSPIFDDSSDDEEDEQTPVTTISKKGSIQSDDPEGNIHIGDNKLGGKRRKKTRKRRKKKKTKKRGGGRRKTRKKRKTKRKRKRKR